MARHSKSDLWEVLQQGHEGDLRFQASCGKLTMEGKRLDAPSSPLRTWIPDGYGDKGFQATELIFPTVGCWEVTGKVANASLPFVTQVIKVAERK
jgi:hypothetical protein